MRRAEARQRLNGSKLKTASDSRMQGAARACIIDNGRIAHQGSMQALWESEEMGRPAEGRCRSI